MIEIERERETHVKMFDTEVCSAHFSDMLCLLAVKHGDHSKLQNFGGRSLPPFKPNRKTAAIMDIALRTEAQAALRNASQ